VIKVLFVLFTKSKSKKNENIRRTKKSIKKNDAFHIKRVLCPCTVKGNNDAYFKLNREASKDSLLDCIMKYYNSHDSHGGVHFDQSQKCILNISTDEVIRLMLTCPLL